MWPNQLILHLKFCTNTYIRPSIHTGFGAHPASFWMNARGSLEMCKHEANHSSPYGTEDHNKCDKTATRAVPLHIYLQLIHWCCQYIWLCMPCWGVQLNFNNWLERSKEAVMAGFILVFAWKAWRQPQNTSTPLPGKFMTKPRFK
jgi:hypothetical protein